MKKLKIILDCDGVLADTMKKLLKLYNSEYGLNLTKDDITAWDLRKIQKEGTDMTKYFKQRGFFGDLEPIPDSQKYVKLLQDDGHEIFVATASPVEGMVDKVMWLRENFEFIPEENIIMCTRKDVICGDVILDDGLHNLRNSSCTYKVVFDHPWNREWLSTDNFYRVKSWKHFYKLISLISVMENHEREGGLCCV